MEVREFAERVLFSTSLEEKLAGVPVGLRDDVPGKAVGTPEGPGRPEELVMRRDGVRVKYPGERQLESDADRGVLLHFLANHELLATELMALVLLKFPDAPKAFRKGIVRTLQEEQEHTRMYLRRMEACGVRFGELPVNGFFWNSVSVMESPLDYVTRLSLTFEQANLDYSRYYGELFSRVGDAETGAILEQIYKDEISHVGYGLKWFRRWKEEGVDEFSAFEKQLPFPLSPVRAKGDHLLFNEEGRRRAGLSQGFIDRLRVFRRSKGRTPNVYVYNPWAEARAEACLAGDELGFEVDSLTGGMACDLDTLPMAVARKEDVVLVREAPSQGYLDGLVARGIDAPEFVVAGEFSEVGQALAERRLDGVKPWGWEPSVMGVERELRGRCAGNALRVEAWGAGFASLYGKGFGVSVREKVAERVGGFLDCGFWGRVCEGVEEMRGAVGALFAEGWERVVVKSGFGLAGRGMFRIGPDDALPVLSGSCVVEPWVDRVMDFSVQYEMGREGLRQVGMTLLENDGRGMFRSCVVGPKWAKGVDGEVLRFMHARREGRDALSIYGREVRDVLEEALGAEGFVGACGVDGFVWRDGAGTLRLNAVCEVNPRMTMGRMALGCLQRVGAGRYGRLRVATRGDLRRAGVGSFGEFAEKLEGERPVKLGGDGRMVEGCWFLNDPGGAERVLVWFWC